MSTARTLLSVLAVGLGAGTLSAQDGGFDPEQLALVYHRVSSEAFEVNRVAEASSAVRSASNFDRPDVLKAEVARLQSLLAAANAAQEFTTRVNDRISEYDHARGEFAITLFTPGYYMPVQAFGQEYQVVFANAGALKAIPMPKEEARGFDERLNGMGRRITNEIRFRITGKSDPAGAVTGARVVGPRSSRRGSSTRTAMSSSPRTSQRPAPWRPPARTAPPRSMPPSRTSPDCGSA
jgi:hypothetical protein